MSKKNYSSWAEEIDLDELNGEAADKYNISLNVIDDIKDALVKSSARTSKKSKMIHKCRRECWH